MAIKEIIKKKKILFPIIFLGELVVLTAVAIIFDLEINNTLYGLIFVYILFITIVIFLIKIIKDHKLELSTMKLPLFGDSVLRVLYFATALIIFILIAILAFELMDLLG